MKDVVVLDYSTAEVHIYRVSEDTDIESFLESSGHRFNNCYYMVGYSINIIDYRNEKE